MSIQPRTQQRSGSRMDKTDKEREAGVPDANQGGGKIASGNANSGHPANDVILRPVEREQQREARREATAKVATGTDSGSEIGVKGSGMPSTSMAGQLLDDRPGREDPKSKKSST